MCDDAPKKWSNPGFRFSIRDGVVIIFCAVVSIMLWKPSSGYIVLFPLTLGHFFLFCNVFRVRRKYELIWSAVWLANIACWRFFGNLDLWGMFLSQIPFTVMFITMEIRSPRYHGIFCSGE